MTREDDATKGKQFLRAVDFIGDLLDEPGLALLAVVGVVLFFFFSCLVPDASFSGGPSMGPRT